MARRVQFGVELDHNDLVREARQAGQVFSQNMQATASTVQRAGVGAAGGNVLGGLAGVALGGLAGYASMQGAQMLAGQVRAIDETGAAYRRAEQSASMLVGSQERLNDLMAKMDEISGGAATSMEKLSTITQMTALGFADTTEEFERFQRGVAGASMATGFNQSYTQQQLMLAIANQSTMRLDQLGLSISETEARIEELKNSTTGLSDQQIYAEAVLGLLNEKYGDLVDVAADNVTELQKLSVALTDARVAAAAWAQQNVLNPAAGELRYLFGARDYGAVRGYASRFAPFDGENTPDWLRDLDAALTALLPAGLQANAVLGETVAAYERVVDTTGQRNKELQNSMAELWGSYADGEISAQELITAFRVLRGEIDALAAAAYAPMGRPSDWQAGGTPTRIPLADSLWGGGLIGATTNEDERTALAIRQQAQAEREREREQAQRQAEADARRAQAEHERQMRAADAVRDRWVNAAQAVVDEFRSRLDRIPGLMGTSSVTQAQMALAEEGIPQNFADNFIRRLEDELFGSGTDWADVSAQMMYDALSRIGVDTGGMTERGAFETLRQRWADQSLFAAPENLELIDQMAVQAELRLQEMAETGRENIYAMFGVSRDPAAVEAVRTSGMEAIDTFGGGMLAGIPAVGDLIGSELATQVGSAWADSIAEQGLFDSFRDALMADMMDYVSALVGGDAGGGTAPMEVETP